MFKNIFKPKTEDEKIKELVEVKEIDDRIKNIAAIGAQCLSDPLFKRYKADLERSKDEILKLMASTSMPSAEQDGYFLRVCIAKLDVLYMLLESVQNDAEKEQHGKQR